MQIPINRRHFLALASAPLLRGMSVPKIKDVSVITTAPAGVRLTVVKIQTDQDGLYGYGCATFTQRADLVGAAVERYLKPFLIGRPTHQIEHLLAMMHNFTRFPGGLVVNAAISGIEHALWDILGKAAGLPVYQLLGGKCRRGAMIYSHAAGSEISQTLDQAKKLMSQGIKAVRLQVAVPGQAAYGVGRAGSVEERQASSASTLPDDEVFEPGPYMRRTLELFEAARKELGPETEILHDVHERVSPRQAVQFAGLLIPVERRELGVA